jgi:hypothetical protein
VLLSHSCLAPRRLHTEFRQTTCLKLRNEAFRHQDSTCVIPENYSDPLIHLAWWSDREPRFFSRRVGHILGFSSYIDFMLAAAEVAGEPFLPRAGEVVKWIWLRSHWPSVIDGFHLLPHAAVTSQLPLLRIYCSRVLQSQIFKVAEKLRCLFYRTVLGYSVPNLKSVIVL